MRAFDAIHTRCYYCEITTIAICYSIAMNACEVNTIEHGAFPGERDVGLNIKHGVSFVPDQSVSKQFPELILVHQ